MKIPNHLLLFCLLALGAPSALGQVEIHEWTNKDGRTIRAKFVRGDAETVTIFTNGRNFTVKLSDLKPESQILARKLTAPSPPDTNSPDSSTPQSSVPKKGPLPTIRVTDADWGGASLRDIVKVLNSTAEQLWPYAAQDRLDTIIVDRSLSGPIVLYRRGNEKQYLVRLDTHKTFWSQYAFQFAHEFGHIICGYKAGDQSNQWFEESLCETASLFALRRMSEAWKTAPPYPNWKSYGPSFRKYAQDRIDEHPWPKATSVAAWYHENAKGHLRKIPPTEKRTLPWLRNCYHSSRKSRNVGLPWPTLTFAKQTKPAISPPISPTGEMDARRNTSSSPSRSPSCSACKIPAERR